MKRAKSAKQRVFRAAMEWFDSWVELNAAGVPKEINGWGVEYRKLYKACAAARKRRKL